MEPQTENLSCREVISRRVSVLLKELAALRSKPRKDSIHDTRVASRRMRAALEAYRDLFPPREWRMLFKRARQITKSLGRARETEVNLDLLNKLKNTGDMAENLCREYLVERFKRKLSKQQRQVSKSVKALDPNRLKQSVDLLLRTLGEAIPAPVTDKTGVRAGRKSLNNMLKHSHISTFQPTLFDMHDPRPNRSFRVISELAEPILALPPNRAMRRATDEDIHRFRVSAKKLRYAMEIFHPAWPGGLKKEIALLRAVQRAGGDFHDWCVLHERILAEKERLTGDDTPHLGFQLGRLLGDVDERKAALRRKFYGPAAHLYAALRELLPRSPVQETSPRRTRKPSGSPRKPGVPR